ncbi:methyltransferase family protein [Salinisphaera hydrothermalis]|uniref:Protein-S-isoprenylcysteine methyltransferase n=1 Tax=Salinisphaera hydrothermalis (strain C41B8) TaxID=1304275 RepID=A0A084IHX5_SALHC|nr:isoprenylcysteine carboxylmethyltransferase family protein [Salinisphaera hydrothermalis]KEZ76309.1 protein-S-isoprenylcysteine methyltransferase [Salinisphaera hydrothermalis C41B8]
MVDANRDTTPPLDGRPAGGEAPRIYPDEHSIQNADLLTRLRSRRITPRLLLAYAAALGLLLFAAPWAPSYALGCVVVLSGLALRIWTFGHLRKNQNVITTGPYAHTRNPAYVGSALVMTGLFIAAGNPYDYRGLAIWMAGIVALYVFFKHYMPRKYRREYGKLRKLFGPAVDEHAAHVPDFFPRLTPWRSGDTQRFSWACVRANHEWVWPLAGILALIIIGLG